MYGKLFASMYDGTLSECWEALVTMQQLEQQKAEAKLSTYFATELYKTHAVDKKI